MLGALYFHDFASGRLTKLLTVPLWSLGLTVPPDGRSILYSQAEPGNECLMPVENLR